MNDLDERLRDTLRGYAEPVRDEVDLDAVLAGGERLRRGRRTHWVAGGLAAAVAVGAVSYGIASGRPVSGVPAPVAPVSASAPSPTASTDWSGHVSTQTAYAADLPGIGDLGVRSVTVRFRGEPGTDITVTAVADDKSEVSRSGAVKGDVPYVASLRPNLWVVVTPRQASWAFATRADGGAGDVSVDQLSGLGVVIATGERGTELAGVLWKDEDGNWLDGRGDAVDSASLSAGGQGFWYVRDLQLGIVCSGRENNWDEGGCSGLPAGEWSTSGGGWGYTDRRGQTVEKDYQILVVPEGASAPVVMAREGCDSAVGALSVSRRPVVLMSCDVSGSRATVFPAVQYLDASGKVRMHQE